MEDEEEALRVHIASNDRDQALARSQEWLLERLCGLTPADLGGEGCKLCSAAGHAPPAPLRHSWFEITPEPFTPEECATMTSMVCFCDPRDREQLHSLCQLAAFVAQAGASAAAIFWAPHTCPDNSEMNKVDLYRGAFARRLLELGLDGIFPCEAKGVHLALTIRARVSRSDHLCRTVNNLLVKQHTRRQQATWLRHCIRSILWEHLCSRMAACIPPIDHTLPFGPLQFLPNYIFGGTVGAGSTGCVYKLHNDDGVLLEDQVVKVVDKSCIKDHRDLQSLARMIEVMLLLRDPQWLHPCIIQLHEIYHTPTHLCFRMESGGQENLYKRLNARTKGDSSRALSIESAMAIMWQAIVMIAYLHTGPMVMHRDIKPENFMLAETPTTLLMKLVDFDLACIKKPQELCTTVCGTMPFTAPDVVLESKGYNGAVADVWSLGTVFLEIICGVRIVEKSLNLPNVFTQHLADKSFTQEQIARRIRDGFKEAGAVHNILQTCCLPEFEDLLPFMTQIIEGMVVVDPSQRRESVEILESVQEALSTGSLPACKPPPIELPVPKRLAARTTLG